MRNLDELIAKANELYDSEAELNIWIEEFEDLELAKLWHETCVMSKANPFGAGYDDEVYEALKWRGYFNKE